MVRGRGITQRIAALDWRDIAARLDTDGYAVMGSVLCPDECTTLAATYAVDERFRSRIVMAQHGFGRGEYKYFAYPLPHVIAELRTALYPHLASIANRWNESLGTTVRYPADHAAFLQRCHRAGQTRPTPLLLQYGAGDYNCLHQDLYGEHVFPLQVTVLLSVPGRDFTGGEFVLMEQRPRRQSRADVVPLGQGDGVIFPVHHRPVPGTRGTYRVNLRHGVSRCAPATAIRRASYSTMPAEPGPGAAPGVAVPRSRQHASRSLVIRPSTVDKQRLLINLDRAWTAFKESYAGLSASRLTEPGVTGDWSVKDILAHVTTWEGEALTHLPLIIAGGRSPRYVRVGGIDAFNARMTEEKRGLSLPEVLRQLDDTHGRLIDFIQRTPHAQFTGDTRFRRRLRLDTYSHYSKHAASMREWRAQRLGE